MLLNKKIPLKYIISKVKMDALNVLLIIALVYVLTHFFGDLLPDLPLTIPAFIGTAISILLSFKLNQSYDRWWEARKIWGSIVNDSRSFVVQVQTLTNNVPDVQIRKMAYRQIAWCYSLGQSLRGIDGKANIDHLVEKDEIGRISHHQNIPLALVQSHAYDLALIRKAGQVSDYHHVQLDSTLVRLVDSMGRAERIKSTVFPVTYRMFLHFIIYLFIVTLSVSLSEVEPYFEVPLLLVISIAFFLLEKTATHMQDPFNNKPTDTAMTAIARKIEINIRQLLNEKELPTVKSNDDFYLM